MASAPESGDGPGPGGGDDAELVRRLSQGDRDAFAVLFQRYHRAVYRFAVQMTGSRDAADDVTQDAFVALARSSARYDAAKGSVATYLYGIARHLTRRYERGRRAPMADVESLRDDPRLAADSADPEEALFRERRLADLRRAILALPPRYREAVVLCDLHGLSYEAAAQAARCPVGTIRSRLSRARALLVERCRALSAANEGWVTRRGRTWASTRHGLVGPES